jgi:hypothetical protein
MAEKSRSPAKVRGGAQWCLESKDRWSGRCKGGRGSKAGSKAAKQNQKKTKIKVKNKNKMIIINNKNNKHNK